MSSFENVTVVKKANIYFNGKVTSRTILFADGSKKTLGVMLPGEYTFSTELPELMEIQSGEMKYRVGGSEKWIDIKAGQSFKVPGKSSFELLVATVMDYCCSFLKG